MLVLSRKPGEELVIGDDIRLIVYRVEGKRVQLGIIAPQEISVHRAELLRGGHNAAPRKRLLKAR